MEKLKKSTTQYDFDKGYLGRISREAFIKDNEHLKHLPLSKIWDEANPKKEKEEKK